MGPNCLNTMVLGPPDMRIRVCRRPLSDSRNRSFALAIFLLALSLSQPARSSSSLEWVVPNDENVQKILSTEESVSGAKQGTIYLVGCRGQTESASVAVLAGAMPLMTVSVVATDLHGEQGNLDASTLDLKLVKTWYQAESAGKYIKRWSPHARTLVAELLVHDDGLIKVDYDLRRNYLRVNSGKETKYIDISREETISSKPLEISINSLPIADAAELLPFDVDSRQNRQLWITATIPANASPGKYSGALHVSTSNRREAAIPIQITVLPFALDQTKREISMYYRGVLGRSGTISSETKSESQYRAELLDLRAHGVTNPNVYQGLSDTLLLRKALAIREEAGFTAKPLYYLGITTSRVGLESRRHYSEELRKLRRVVEGFKISDIYVYGIDEAREDVIASQRQAWEYFHSLGVKIFVAGWTEGHFNLIGDIVDLFVAGTKPSFAEVDDFHKGGKRIFLYNQPQVGVEDLNVYRSSYGITIWRLGYDGVMPYAYQHGFGSIWNDFDQVEYRDHAFTYPTRDGVIGTLQWEGFRQGIADIRYIETLERYVAEADASSPLPGTRQAIAVTRGRELLRRLRFGDSDSAAKMRESVIERITEIHSAQYSSK